MEGPFSTPVCTRKQKSRLSSADLAFSIASCNSRHAWSATVKTLRPGIAPPDRKLPNKPGMEPLQGGRTVFYARLYKKAEE